MNSTTAQKAEILAPAGSFECMKAAFLAGADAVYAGGAMFGARASAVNFSGEELLDAIDYAHLHGKKFYLTINTLLKEQELEQDLYPYLLPAYEHGLDAVIVQDLGVLKFIREYFPSLPVHASTQMNVTGPYFGRELKRLGVTRIVTSRELSLEEINRIYQATGLEIESFVHGALCYCYSGQCLLSSMIGGRSGNRGRCAQPCRLAYETDGIKGKKYLLSPKDLCTLSLIPDILDSGVYSLKVEGRMKKPEYVASVTRMYRKYVDLYLEKGREHYHVEEADILQLKDIYNRGGFTDGYYIRHNSKDMMSIDRPNHCGVAVGLITELNRQNIAVRITEALNKGDVLEFDVKNASFNYTLGQPMAPGEILRIRNRFQDAQSLKESALRSREVARIRNNALIDELNANYLQPEDTISVCGEAIFCEGEKASLTIRCLDTEITEYGAVVQKAQSSPLIEEDIRKKMMQTGTSGFVFKNLKLHVGEDIFVPVGELKALRRNAFETLRQELSASYQRRDAVLPQKQEWMEELEDKKDREPAVSVLVSNMEQYRCISDHPSVTRIYVELAEFDVPQLRELLLNGSVGIYLALPYIFRGETEKKMEAYLELMKSDRVSGFLVRNLESFFWLKEQEASISGKNIISDSQIYCYNRRTKEYLKSLGIDENVCSKELNHRELAGFCDASAELEIYGAIPVMFSAGCIKKTGSRCDGKTENIRLTDRKGQNLTVHTVCRYCYNILYYPEVLWLLEDEKDWREIRPLSVRFSFTTETAEQCKNILDLFTGKGNGTEIQRGYTKGHFKRGVL